MEKERELKQFCRRSQPRDKFQLSFTKLNNNCEYNKYGNEKRKYKEHRTLQ